MQEVIDKEMDVRRGWTSASNAEADSLCQKRFLAQRGLPRPDPGPDAERGRHIHRLLSSDQIAGEMEKLPVDIREMFDACRKIEKALVNKFFTPEDGKQRVFREKPDGSSRLWCKIPDGNGGFFEHSGEPDVVYRAGTKALIIEYKTLAGDIPEAPENRQLRDQAVLVRGNHVVVDTIGVAVDQPLVTHSPSICVYTKEDLDRAEREMFDRVRASHDPNAKAFAGQVQCAFCLAKRYCVEYQKFAAGMVPAVLGALEIPMIQWTPEQRAMAANNLGSAQKFLDELKDFIKDGLAKDPDFCPGWGLKAGAVKRSITNPQKVFERFNLIGGTLEGFMGCITVGITKLKEQIYGATGAKGKALDEAFNTVTADCVAEKQIAPSLVKLQ